MRKTRFIFLSLITLALLWPYSASAGEKAHLNIKDVRLSSQYPWKRDILTTCFWVGEGTCGYNSTTNVKSAWDEAWTHNFGGVDSPDSRNTTVHTGKTSLPKNFAPTLNPFYVALPYNDIKYPDRSRKYVPWWNHQAWRRAPLQSQCKGKWIMIEYKGKVAFAQWEDVGPFRYDDVKYVFTDRNDPRGRAGLDISPAIRDYLGLKGKERTNWRFVEDEEVPYGPWIHYGEQAILYSAIKKSTPSKS